MRQDGRLGHDVVSPLIAFANPSWSFGFEDERLALATRRAVSNLYVLILLFQPWFNTGGDSPR